MKAENRTFVISGGSSGLGLATAHDLLAAGAYIAVIDLNPPPEDLVSSGGKRVKYVEVDITSLPDIERAVEGTVKWTQETGARLGGVINCAGVGLPGKILDFKNEPHPLDRWEFVLAVNLTGAFNLTRLLLPHLSKVEPEHESISVHAGTAAGSSDDERGIIIFASSAAAFEGQIGQTSYSAAKGALASMTLPMARDLAPHGIRVVTIAPGIFESAMTQKMIPKVRRSLEREAVFPRRFGHAHEFARTVRWIVECAYVNGETIRLSGAARLPYKL